MALDENYVRIAYNMAVMREPETHHQRDSPDVPHGKLFVI
jgi:hypothetical protein